MAISERPAGVANDQLSLWVVSTGWHKVGGVHHEAKWGIGITHKSSRAELRRQTDSVGEALLTAANVLNQFTALSSPSTGAKTGKRLVLRSIANAGSSKEAGVGGTSVQGNVAQPPTPSRQALADRGVAEVMADATVGAGIG